MFPQCFLGHSFHLPFFSCRYLYKKDSDDSDPWKEWTPLLNAIDQGVPKSTDQWKRCWYDTFVKPGRPLAGMKRKRESNEQLLDIKPELNESGTDLKKKRSNDRCLSKNQKIRMKEFLEQNPHATDPKYFISYGYFFCFCCINLFF